MCARRYLAVLIAFSQANSPNLVVIELQIQDI